MNNNLVTNNITNSMQSITCAETTNAETMGIS